MEVTFKQAFNLLDGRMSTNIGDIYMMLNHIFSTSFFTHELPVAYDKLKELNPEWFSEGVKRLEAIKTITQSNDFNILMDYIDKNMVDEFITLEKVQ